MKKIILVRHGKAEDPDLEISDYERSLTVKGKKISRVMAQRLLEKEREHVVLITSPAFRALETAIIFAETFGIEPENIILRNMMYYKMNFQYLPELLSLAKEEINTIILFGHNPSFTDIANILSKQGCDFLPKSGIATISFNVMTWSEIRRDSGKLEYFLKPEKVL